MYCTRTWFVLSQFSWKGLWWGSSVEQWMLALPQLLQSAGTFWRRQNWCLLQTQWEMATWGKKSDLTTGNRKRMRKTPSIELALKMKNRRLLRGKEHLPEAENWLKAELLKCQQRDQQRFWFGQGSYLNSPL